MITPTTDRQTKPLHNGLVCEAGCEGLASAVVPAEEAGSFWLRRQDRDTCHHSSPISQNRQCRPETWETSAATGHVGAPSQHVHTVTVK